MAAAAAESTPTAAAASTLPSYAYFDVTINGAPQPRVVIELFKGQVPKTVANFAALCEGADGAVVPGTTVPMSYKGVSFHRVIKSFMIQSGDFTNHNGTGGRSIYGDKFEDECFTNATFSGPGLLAMANAGPNTNGSQFFITCADCPHLNGKHVIFGRVVRGMNTVRAVEYTPTGENDRPVVPCNVADCGVLPDDSPPPEVAAEDGDHFSDYPQDSASPLSDEDALKAADAIRAIGNKHFTEKTYARAIEKYTKSLRYLDAVPHPTTAMKPEVDKKRIACYSNMAQCHIKLEQWVAARNAASKGVAIDANDVKLVFRRGVASMGMNELDEALSDLRRCHQTLDPTNPDIAASLARCQELMKEQREKQAANYRKMFA